MPSDEVANAGDDSVDDDARSVQSTSGNPADDGGGALAEASPVTGEQVPPPEPEPVKRSPAEAFGDLADVVHRLRGDVDEIGGVVRLCRDKLVRQAEEHRFAGLSAALESVVRLHDLVFHQVLAMEAGETRPDVFTVNLLETLEGELATLGVEVLRPHPGDELHLEVMTTIGAEPCAFWRKPDRVARVAGCGFVLRESGSLRMLRKAQVTVYRRK